MYTIRVHGFQSHFEIGFFSLSCSKSVVQLWVFKNAMVQYNWFFIIKNANLGCLGWIKPNEHGIDQRVYLTDKFDDGAYY